MGQVLIFLQLIGYLIAMIVALVFMIHGFKEIFKTKTKTDTDPSVIQRQLRGFGFLALAPFILIAGKMIVGTLFSLLMLVFSS